MKFIFDPDKGNVRVEAEIKSARKMFDLGVRAALIQVGQDLVRYTVTGIERGPKTGRQYGVYKKDGIKKLYPVRGSNGKVRLHQASGPNEYPAILNGDYVRSIKFEKRGSLDIDFGSTDKKAPWLENGTPKMAPRNPIKNSVKAREKEAFNYLRWEAILGYKPKK